MFVGDLLPGLDRDQIHYSDDFFIILFAVTTTAATTTTGMQDKTCNVNLIL